MKWNPDPTQLDLQPASSPQKSFLKSDHPAAIYAEPPSNFNFLTLQRNLQGCLSIVNNEIMKAYVPSLHNCQIIPMDEAILENLPQIQFFRITELVYQEDEFSVHKLATVFHALSSKPCTLVLMIKSDGQNNEFYLGVRSREPKKFSTGTMRQLLEQSLLGLFPGSNTDDYFNEDLNRELEKLNIGAVSSVTCIADYKQDKDSLDNKEFIQGLEKFVYSMQGKAFTAVMIANNLEYQDLAETRKEYERVYTLISPFANMQYNYATNNSSSSSNSQTTGQSEAESRGASSGISTNQSISEGVTKGTSVSRSQTDTTGTNESTSTGKTHTTGISDGVNDSTTTTGTVGTFISKNVQAGIGIPGIGNIGTGSNVGISASVSRGKTHGTSHTDSISDSVSQNLTKGISNSKSIGTTTSENESITKNQSTGTGTQYTENYGTSLTSSYNYTQALTDTFGSSQAVTLNVQNKSLLNTLQRLEKQMERLDECESIGMWDFAAYFLGESAAEAETAASMYYSLISGDQSGLEVSAINTWTDEEAVQDISKYVTNFLHPVFLYKFAEDSTIRQTAVDATVLASTNELAIQLGLPRKSIKGLPVIEHAVFAQEVLNHDDRENTKYIDLGKVNHLGRDTDTDVQLNLNSLTMHTFITGSTGSGKSNTVYQLLSELSSRGVHFLVVEPAKGEYKNVFGRRRDVAVYGTNPNLTRLLRINPFSFPAEIHIYEHMDRLVEIFNVCWPMYAAMPAVLKDAIERAYKEAGWNLRTSTNKYDPQLFPTFADVLRQIDLVMNESQYSADSKGDYKGALSTRLKSLTNGINSMIFCADEISSEELFDRNVIIDLSRVGSTETKSLIMGLLVIKLQEYRMSKSGMNETLKHITVLEEAHNLLKNTSTDQGGEGANLAGKSVEMLTNAIAEMRTYGEGFIIADQAPGLLDMAVIRNTNTKIILRLPEYADRKLVGKAIDLTDEQIDELSRLSKGVAAVYQNDWLESVLCKVKKYHYNENFLFNQPDDLADTNVKGNLISRILSRDLEHLTDRIDIDLICSNLPTKVKCRFFEYIKATGDKRIELASAIAYDLCNCDQIEADLLAADSKRQRSILKEHVKKELDGLPPKYLNSFLYLAAYWCSLDTKNEEIMKLTEQLSKECNVY